MTTLRKFQGHPQSAAGDFYVVNGECVACAAPHVVAPDLIGWAVGSEYEHCIWKKQPETSAEMDHAIAVFEASDLGCHRYAGTDLSMIKRLGADYCDNAPPGAATEFFKTADIRPREFRLTLIPGNAADLALKFAFALLISASVFLAWMLFPR